MEMVVRLTKKEVGAILLTLGEVLNYSDVAESVLPIHTDRAAAYRGQSKLRQSLRPPLYDPHGREREGVR